MKNNDRILVLFDFDGTITRRDSFLPFLLFSCSFLRLAYGFLGLVKLAVIDGFQGKWTNTDGKKLLMKLCYGGKTYQQLNQKGTQFVASKLPKIIDEKMLLKLRRYVGEGHEVVVVSASFDLWLEPFCAREGVALICTELSYDPNNIFQGEWNTSDCNHEEKVSRIKSAYNLNAYDKVIAFGNTKGDLPMLTMANEANWVKHPVTSWMLGL